MLIGHTKVDIKMLTSLDVDPGQYRIILPLVAKVYVAMSIRYYGGGYDT